MASPEHDFWADHGPLRRFEADMRHAKSLFDLYNAYVTYMQRQFSIPEEAAMKLHRHAEETAGFPGIEVFESDPMFAHELTRLALMRTALPFAEGMIENDDVFENWLLEASKAAMNISGSPHEIETCVLSSGGNTGLGCAHREVCPVRVVKHTLILEVMSPNYESPDYEEPWATTKVGRTLAKLDVAGKLGLTVPLEANALKRSYVFRTKSRGITVADESDI